MEQTNGCEISSHCVGNMPAFIDSPVLVFRNDTISAF
jgi:hypothetical protein